MAGKSLLRAPFTRVTNVRKMGEHESGRQPRSLIARRYEVTVHRGGKTQKVRVNAMSAATARWKARFIKGE
jgi:hypothetical protein